MVAVAGCVAQAEGEEIIRRAPAVDLVVGPQNYHRLPELLRAPRAASKRGRHRFPGRRQVRPSAARRRPRRPARAASAPSSPCRKAATSSAPSASCPIRAARKFRVRSTKILAEIERLAAAGVREITLIGQNVNAYHGEGADGRPALWRGCSHAPRRHPGHRAAALHHEPSARHGRRADRGASRSAGADAAICICRCNRAPTAFSLR